MSTTTPAPHPQVFLPGQAHLAHGPHDHTGMYVFHHALRRDLARFEAAVRRTPVGERRTWSRLQRRWARFGEVLHHHHHVEDESIWPLMRARLEESADHADRGAVAVLDAMEAEHGDVDPALEHCIRAFEEMAEHPCAEHRDVLDARVTAARALLLAHLAHEETEALPLWQRALSAEDHAATERAAQRAYPARTLPFLLPWAFDGVPPEVARRLLDGDPVSRLLLRALTPRFRRSEGRVFRHA